VLRRGAARGPVRHYRPGARRSCGGQAPAPVFASQTSSATSALRPNSRDGAPTTQIRRWRAVLANIAIALENQLSNAAIPAIVEGPIDAVAVTLASRGAYIGVAPLGTSLTDEQAHQLARIGTQPIVATDADLAGRIAAERHYWVLSCYRLDPLQARLPDRTDPADLLALRGPTALTEALAAAQPLAEQLIDERLANLPPGDALLEATRVVAARPSRHWDQGSSAISSQLGIPTVQVRHALRTFVNEWNTDPRQAARQPLQTLGEVKRRISKAIELATQHPRTALPRQLDQHPQQAGDTYRTPEAKRIPPPSRAGRPRTPTR
jgi:DNA primase